MAFLKLYEDFLQKKEDEHRYQLPTNDVPDAAEQQQITAKASDGKRVSLGFSSQRPKKMEHSYMSRSANNVVTNTGLQPARTILVRRAPQCPSCHTHPLDEEDMEDDHKVPVPAYNEIAAKEAMNECVRIAKYVRNQNSDDEDWVVRIPQINLNELQKNLLEKVSNILTSDYLGRLAHAGRAHEAVQRRILIDTSAARMRKALTDVFWDVRLTQWLHSTLMEYLPSTYMAGYLDILQTLKYKVPHLMDKMLFGRPLNFSQELLAPIMQQRWEPIILPKTRKSLNNAIILVISSHFGLGRLSKRQQRWYQQLSNFAEIFPITLPTNNNYIMRQPLEQIAEQVVSLTRVKIQELRSDDSTRSIILLGFNAGAAMALQVAMSVSISCVICMGFAYNTLHGARGAPDDRLLDIKVPILFVIGQNSARTSPEEVESLRERMLAESALLVVGSADDVLRVPKSRKRIENVTQAMVDTMILDEVYDYIKRTLANPPGLRTPLPVTGVIGRVNKSAMYGSQLNVDSAGTVVDGKASVPRKRKLQEVQLNENEQTPKSKYVGAIGRPRVRPLPGQAVTSTPTVVLNANNAKKVNVPPKPTVSSFLASDDLNDVMHTILSEDSNDNSEINTLESSPSGKPMTSFELVAQSSKTTPIKSTTNTATSIGSKIKLIPSNQFVQLKPNGTNSLQTPSKIFTIKTNPPPAVLNATNTGLGSIVPSPITVNSQPSKIFTIKGSNSNGQQKYTVVKSAIGGMRLQLTSTINAQPTVTTTTTTAANENDVDLCNIINMPIVFADQQGNITENVAAANVETTTAVASKASVTKFLATKKINKPINVQATTSTDGGNTSNNSPTTLNIGGTTYIINQSPPQLNKKVVLINRNTLKPCSSKIIKCVSGNTVQAQPLKYGKIILDGSGTKLIPIGATKPFSMQPKNTPGTAAIQINKTPLNVSSAGTSAVRNIVLKPSNFSKLPAHLKTQLLANRTTTARKLVNIVSVANYNGGSTLTDSMMTEEQDRIVSSARLQTVPKIITLDPLSATIDESETEELLNAIEED